MLNLSNIQITADCCILWSIYQQVRAILTCFAVSSMYTWVGVFSSNPFVAAKKKMWLDKCQSCPPAYTQCWFDTDFADLSFTWFLRMRLRFFHWRLAMVYKFGRGRRGSRLGQENKKKRWLYVQSLDGKSIVNIAHMAHSPMYISHWGKFSVFWSLTQDIGCMIADE